MMGKLNGYQKDQVNEKAPKDEDVINFQQPPLSFEELKELLGTHAEDGGKRTKKAKQLKTKKRWVGFLILMILSGAAAVLVLNFANFPALGTTPYVLLACICVVLVLTFLVSGIGLFANLFQWMGEE